MPRISLPSFRVISEARTYRQAALLLESAAHDTSISLLAPASMLAAYAIELYLKSFLVQDNSVPLMQIEGEIIFYGALAVSKKDFGHDLSKLYHNIQPAHKVLIEKTSEAIKPDFKLSSELDRFRLHFPKIRYSYELASTSLIRGELFDLMDHLEVVFERLLPKVYQPDRF